MPSEEWSWFRDIKTRLHQVAPVHSPRGPVITSVQLLKLGLLLMEEGKPAPGAPISIEDAVQYRDGLMFALLALFRFGVKISLRWKSVNTLFWRGLLVCPNPRQGGQDGNAHRVCCSRAAEPISCYLSRYRSSAAASARGLRRTLGE